MKEVLIIIAAITLTLTAVAENYYVSPEGSNDNDGLSADMPFQTIQYAHGKTQAGDTVFVMEGVYTVNKGHILLVTRSGKENEPIVYKGMGESKPVLFAPKSTSCWAAIRIEASHIVIDGLELKGDNENITLEEGEAVHDYYKATASRNWDYVATTNTNGIYIIGNRNTHIGPKHVTIKNCLVHNFPGAGISAEVSDYITIIDNVVHSTAWYMIWAGSGISFFHPYNSDKNNTDYKNIIERNICYLNETKVKWADQNKYSDGNGIIVDDTKNTQIGKEKYTGKTYVANNICYLNGGSGLNVYSSENVDIVNNTFYKNNQSPHINYSNLAVNQSHNINVVNNIAYAKGTDRANSSNVASNKFENNLFFNGTVENWGTNPVKTDPLFVDPDNGDFRLQEGSPAIDAGSGRLAPNTDIEGKPRPQGRAHDLGAFETESEYTKVNQLRNTGIKIHPNPAISGSTISIELDQLNDGLKAEIIDLNGKTIKTYNGLTNGFNTINIDLSPGVYLLKTLKRVSSIVVL